MIKIIRRCQNSRLVEGFHLIFDESVVAPLFLPFLAYMGPFLVIFWVLEVSHSVTFLPKYAPRSGKDWEKRKFTCTWSFLMYMQIFVFPSLYLSHGHIWAKISRYAPPLTPKKCPKTDPYRQKMAKKSGATTLLWKNGWKPLTRWEFWHLWSISIIFRFRDMVV